MNKSFESAVIVEQMCLTLTELNKYFIKKDNINKEEFMNLQSKCWNKVKKRFNIKFGKRDNITGD